MSRFMRNNSLADQYSLERKNHLHDKIFSVENKSYFLTWFDRELEKAVEHLWQTSPSAAFTVHQSMLELLQLNIRTHLPEILTHGCAPLPACSAKTNQVLNEFELYQQANGQLNRIYAVLTYWPWQGGCCCCSLQQTCTTKGMRSVFVKNPEGVLSSSFFPKKN